MTVSTTEFGRETSTAEEVSEASKSQLHRLQKPPKFEAKARNPSETSLGLSELDTPHRTDSPRIPLGGQKAGKRHPDIKSAVVARRSKHHASPPLPSQSKQETPFGLRGPGVCPNHYRGEWPLERGSTSMTYLMASI